MKKTLATAIAALLASGVANAEQQTLPELGSNSGNAFNPAISVILDAGYYHDKGDEPWHEAIAELPGFALGHSHGDDHDHGHGPEDGFNLFHAEVIFSASVDNLFDAVLNLGIDEDGVEIEEAYGLTRNLPGGLQLKMGKFFSGIGYLNSQHSHEWDFADQALPYRLMFGDHGLNEKGLQLTWTAPTDNYLLLGAEILQGENEKLIDYKLSGNEYGVGSESKGSGPRLLTAFTKFSPDMGHDHALQIGFSGGQSRISKEVHGSRVYEGKPWFIGTDWVYKYDAGGHLGHGSLTIQAEYIRRVFERKVVATTELASGRMGEVKKDTQDAMYIQGVYGIAPRWRAGLRYELAGMTNEHIDNGVTEKHDSSNRITANLTWQPTEFSKLRLQASQSRLALEDGKENFRQVYLQYQLALGAHGAHRF